MQDALQRIAAQILKKNMDVIGHDAPSEEADSLAVEFLERERYHSGHRWISQVTCARPGVEIRLHSPRVKLPEAKSFRIGERAAHYCCGLRNVAPGEPNPLQDLFWKRIG